MPDFPKPIAICAVMISIVAGLAAAQVLRVWLDDAMGLVNARGKARCEAFVNEGFEAETRWSEKIGCMAKRADGWERL